MVSTNFQSKVGFLKESNSFKQISTIDDWNEYFTNTKELLEQELAALQKEIIITGNLKNHEETNS